MPGSYADLAGIGAGRNHAFRSSVGQPSTDFVDWLTVPFAAASAPRVDDGFVVRPEFCCARDSFIGSYGFIVDGPCALLLTALHVMSALALAKGVDCSAKNASYAGRELPALVTKVNLFDAFAAQWMMAELGTAGPMIALPEARMGEEEPFSLRDIAAFRSSPSAKVSPGRLASRCLSVGDPIWLAAKQNEGGSARTLQAVVVEATEKTLVFRYAKSKRPAPNTSGAPLLNQAGEVVGINVGVGVFDGHCFGHANHVGSIRRHLSAIW